MTEILVGRASDPVFDANILDSLYRFRYDIFYKRLQWDVKTIGGRERDHYDDLDPFYIVSVDRERNEVDGCWRLLPTNGPYMLKDTFPELLAGEAVPSSPRIWEMSRFAVKPPHPDARVQVSFTTRCFELMLAAYRFANEHDVDEYVTVTSVAVERMMRSAGIPLTRLGDGSTIRIGRVLTVACRVPVVADGDLLLSAALEASRAGKEAA